MRELLKTAADRAGRYLDHLDGRDVYPTSEGIEQLKTFDAPMPETPTDAARVLEILDEIGSPATVADKIAHLRDTAGATSITTPPRPCSASTGMGRTGLNCGGCGRTWCGVPTTT